MRIAVCVVLKRNRKVNQSCWGAVLYDNLLALELPESCEKPIHPFWGGNSRPYFLMEVQQGDKALEDEISTRVHTERNWKQEKEAARISIFISSFVRVITGKQPKHLPFATPKLSLKWRIKRQQPWSYSRLCLGSAYAPVFLLNAHNSSRTCYYHQLCINYWKITESMLGSSFIVIFIYLALLLFSPVCLVWVCCLFVFKTWFLYCVALATQELQTHCRIG